MGKIYTVDEITAAVKPIAEKYGIDKVWLFGSYARGEATEKSLISPLTWRYSPVCSGGTVWSLMERVRA